MWKLRNDEWRMTASSRDSYRKAEQRLRDLLFGDGVYTAGLVKGDEQRQRVTAALHRMREAFDEMVQASERTSPNLAEDLLDAPPGSQARDPRSGT